MSYNATRVTKIQKSRDYAVGTRNIKTIEVDIKNKVIIIRYENNERRISIVPIDGPIEIIESEPGQLEINM